MALQKKMQRLWKASRIYNIPLTHPYLRDINDYDLTLMEYLHRFEDPREREEYLTVVVDEDFENYVKETEAMNGGVNISVEDYKDEWEELK